MQNIPKDVLEKDSKDDYYISLTYKTVSELAWVIGDRRYGVHSDVDEIVGWFNSYIAAEEWKNTISDIGIFSLQDEWATPDAPGEFLNNSYIT